MNELQKKVKRIRGDEMEKILGKCNGDVCNKNFKIFKIKVYMYCVTQWLERSKKVQTSIAGASNFSLLLERPENAN